MKAMILLSLAALSFGQGAVRAQEKQEKGWQSLFDGKTLKGWRSATRDSLPGAGWSVSSGELVFDPSAGHGGDIITDRSFTNFELSLDFKVSEGGNSGIKYFLIPHTSLGCEFQILDDQKHPDAQLGREGNRKTGSLYDLIPANPGKPYKGAGQWNTARIIVQGNRVEHWLNGSRILAYDRSSEAFRQAIALSKFKNTAGFASALSSPILLQAHGDLVHFRNIRIKER